MQSTAAVCPGLLSRRHLRCLVQVLQPVEQAICELNQLCMSSVTWVYATAALDIELC